MKDQPLRGNKCVLFCKYAYVMWDDKCELSLQSRFDKVVTSYQFAERILWHLAVNLSALVLNFIKLKFKLIYAFKLYLLCSRYLWHNFRLL